MQEINLYGPALRGTRTVFSVTVIGVAAGVAVLSVLVAWIYTSGWQLPEAREQAAAVRAPLEQRRAEMMALTQQGGEQADPALERRLERSRMLMERKLQLLGALHGDKVPAAAGFSALLAGLGRQRMEGLWLEEILIGAGGAELVLRGSALKEAYVPAYLQALAHEPAYQGREFETLRIERAEAARHRLDFTLVTDCRSEEGKALKTTSCAGRQGGG